jgi:hypothetical protein
MELGVGSRVSTFGRFGEIIAVEHPEELGGQVRYVVEVTMRGRTAAPIVTKVKGTVAELRLVRV